MSCEWHIDCVRIQETGRWSRAPRFGSAFAAYSMLSLLEIPGKSQGQSWAHLLHCSCWIQLIAERELLREWSPSAAGLCADGNGTCMKCLNGSRSRRKAQRFCTAPHWTVLHGMGVGELSMQCHGFKGAKTTNCQIFCKHVANCWICSMHKTQIHIIFRPPSSLSCIHRQGTKEAYPVLVAGGKNLAWSFTERGNFTAASDYDQWSHGEILHISPWDQTRRTDKYHPEPTNRTIRVTE